MYFSLVALVLTKALFTELCDTLNVTVNPGPVAMVVESDNMTLSCLVSHRKRSSSVLVLRWFYTPDLPASPPSTPATLLPTEILIVRLGVKKLSLYGNYTRAFPQPKFLLHEEREGEVFQLLIFNVTGADQGSYICRVQEIRKHRNTWRASSNGTARTQLSVHFTLEDGSSEGVLRLFADVYLCAALICSLGLLSIFLFMLVLSCQHLLSRHRLKAASYLLVKCPESSSGEMVTSSTSSSGSTPKAQRKEMRQKPERKARPTPAPAPKCPDESPPHIPMKVPVATQRPRKPRRLKAPPKRSVTRVSQEDSLTYAELELVRPRLEPPASSSSSSPSSPDPATSETDTVYAQILFQEKQM